MKKISFERALPIICIIICIGMVISLMSLKNEITQLRQIVENQESAATGEYDSEEIASIVTEAMEEKNSNIASADVEYGSFDADRLKGDITVTVTPKEFDANGSAYLIIGSQGDKIPMERKGQGYACRTEIDVNQDISMMTFSVLRDGKICNSIFYGSDWGAPYDSWMDLISDYMYYGDDTEVEAEAEAIVKIRKEQATGKTPVVHFIKNGKEVEKKKMTAEGEEDGGEIYGLDRKKLNEGNYDEAYAEYVMKNGLTYRYCIWKWTDEENMEEYYLVILDKDGHEIYDSRKDSEEEQGGI